MSKITIVQSQKFLNFKRTPVFYLRIYGSKPLNNANFRIKKLFFYSNPHYQILHLVAVEEMPYSRVGLKNILITLRVAIFTGYCI